FLRRMLMAAKIWEAELAAGPSASDADMKAAYATYRDVFREEQSVRASLILIRVAPQATAAARARAKATIDGVLKKARAGEDFGKLAQQYSQDSSAAEGGDIGFLPQGQLGPGLDTAVAALP